jgi:micrococcal nuclease
METFGMKKLAILGFAMFLPLVGPAWSQQGKLGVTVRNIRVLDGDTVELNKTHKIRLLDVDAPEIFSSGLKKSTCPLVEKELGLKAAARVRELMDLSQHKVTVQYKGGKDLYGRNLGNIFSDGKNVGSTLVSEGLALPWKVGKQSRPVFCMNQQIRLQQHRSGK